MRIGIIGAGEIGSALAVHFRTLAHTVLIANSRGPETLCKVAEQTGAAPVSISEVAAGIDLLVITIPMKSVPLLPKDLFRELPAASPIIDTGNYILPRDGEIDEIEAGLADSEWTSKVLHRSVIKAFNNIATYNLIHCGLPRDSEHRIALPIAGDDTKAKQFVSALIDDMGFDGVDAGPLSESWRQQPGTPAYCTAYDHQALEAALESANRMIAPQMAAVTMQKLLSLPPDTPPQELVGHARALWKQE